MTWATLERPGQFGTKYREKHDFYDGRYGEDNWRIVWLVNDHPFTLEQALMLYEDAYFSYLQQRRDLLEELLREASDVYDNSVLNSESGLDYGIQNATSHHFQDIAIRRVVSRLGHVFTGSKTLQIRGKWTNEQPPHPLSVLLSPGKVPFHMPELIEQPELEGWWDPGSVESFYQSNKYVQAKRRGS